MLTEFAALKSRVEELLAELAALNARVAELLGENAALKAQLEQRTRDAKRQAAPFSKGQRTAQPKCPGRKPGQGHFTFRTLPRPDQWTASPIEVRLPEPVCPCCGATAHRMGPRVMAAAHATHDGLGVPVRKVPAVPHLYTGVRLTQSAITQDASRRVSGPVGREDQTFRDQVPTSDVVSTDDTGWRIGGDSARLMTFVTDTVTVFQVRAPQRNEEVREVIGDDYAGVLVTDRGKSYDAKELEQVKQQKCLYHAPRSITEVLETKQGRARHFGARLKTLLKGGLELWHEYHAHRGQLAGFERRARSLREEVTRHLRPRRLVDADNQRLLDQFGRHHARGNLLRFLEDPRVPPTNNASERGFRFAVIQRKVSQCSKTAGGARAFEAFASVIKTAMRQGKDVVERLTG